VLGNRQKVFYCLRSIYRYDVAFWLPEIFNLYKCEGT